jgi:hypothetical protein
MSDIVSDRNLHDQLSRWVAAGLIGPEQAARIEAAEAARLDRAPAAAAAPALAGRAPLVVEALGYLGGALAIIAGFITVGQLWPDIPTGAQLAFAATAAVLLAVAGAVVRAGGDPAFGRLRSVLWAMSTACLAAFVGVLAAQVLDIAGVSIAVLTAAVTTAYAAALWWFAPVPLQQLILFAGAAVTVGTGIARLDSDLITWGPGLGVWTLSGLWAVAVHHGYLRPPTAAYLAAAVGLLIGAQLTMEVAAGHVLALATVAALLAAGVALRAVWLLGIGALGVLLVVPTAAVRYLPESVGAPLSILAVGLILLGVALWLARWPRSRRAS